MYMNMHRPGGTDGDRTDRADALEAVMVHDLTNHLQIIGVQADILLEELDDRTEVGRAAAIKRQTVAANSLVQTVSEVAETPSRSELEPVDLPGVVRDAVERLRSAYPDAEVTAEMPEAAPVRADGLVSSVVWNLLQNAVLHNDSSTPHVAVAVRSDGSTTFVVEDDGPGLPDGARDGLVGVEPNRPGSGIGIVRALLDRYEATIAVDDGTEGTEISITFPPVDA